MPIFVFAHPDDLFVFDHFKVSAKSGDLTEFTLNHSFLTGKRQQDAKG
jgi:hypothetical protein